MTPYGERGIRRLRWWLAKIVAPDAFAVLPDAEPGFSHAIIIEDGVATIFLRLARWKIHAFRVPGMPDLDVTALGEANKTFLVPIRQRFFSGRIG